MKSYEMLKSPQHCQLEIAMTNMKLTTMAHR
jgi:hypothetical protein